jgi:putative oxidoreductase
MNKLLSPSPLLKNEGLVIIRIVTGLLMAYHGFEVFDHTKIAGYAGWDSIKNMPMPLFMAYLGKGLELLTGLCFVAGLFTRIAAVVMAVNMLFICFKIGNGKFWYDDQHPFLFALLALVFFFTGPGGFSLDKLWFTKAAEI